MRNTYPARVTVALLALLASFYGAGTALADNPSPQPNESAPGSATGGTPPGAATDATRASANGQAASVTWASSMPSAANSASTANPSHVKTELPAPDPSLPAAVTAASADPNQQAIARGAYLARAGDCIACHTAKGGKPFAGGLAIGSPLGTIYSTNITPDKRTGIGDWSFDDFAALMRYGRVKAGYTVYPAMPYPSYSRLSEADLKDLYAYFMNGVRPVEQTNAKNGIPWPLSMRWPLGIWRRLFGPEPVPFDDKKYPNAEIARGAYLVEGLGHCGSCHTPRAVTLQEKALTDADGTIFLSGGGAIDGWIVPSLRNEHGGGLADWSQAEIVQFLRSGRNEHTASFGAMNDVIVDSTQYMTDADLNSIGAYLKTLSPNNTTAKPFHDDETIAKELYSGQVRNTGAQIYIDRCAACHRSNGKGAGKAFPALAGNAILQTNDPTSAIHIVLSGGSQPATTTAPSSLSMPPFARLLNDEQVAQVVTFIQTSWGNQGGQATASQVAKIRKIAKPIDAPGLAPVQRDLRHAEPGTGASTSASGVTGGE